MGLIIRLQLGKNGIHGPYSIKFLLNLNSQKAPKPENIWFNPRKSNKALAKAICLKTALIQVWEYLLVPAAKLANF